MSQLFIKNIEVLDFYQATDSDRSLFLTSQRHDPNLSPSELFELEIAFEFKADAVYFRHFRDKRSAIPQIYLYDNTAGQISNDNLAEIHRDLWSSCRIPMFIVMNKTDFAVYDARKAVTILPNGQITTQSITGKIDLISDATTLYAKRRFDSGIFWESDQAKGNFRESTSAYKDLIDNLKTVRKKFIDSKTLPEKTANKLLVYSILIKYLEERGNQGDRLFAKGWFEEQFGANNLCDVLQKGKVIDLFDQLSRQFNGRIFEWSDPAERILLEKANLDQLASFLDGDSNLETGQRAFWAKYSFNRLPVELISSVYEEFLNERKDAVYTPEFLVDTLVEQCLPEHENDKTSVKTIDVSCGSGIFLVSVFKRLAQRHKYSLYKATGKLPKLQSRELLKIIKDNIFGIDIEEDAVRLAVFSLCLALCDQLEPFEIWNELKFDDTFQKNFTTQNFFKYLNDADHGTFDLVIGNVPFDELGKKPKVYQEIVNSCDEVKENSKLGVYPKKQIALMFLDLAPTLLKAGGTLCLIVPAAPLLYNNSSKFRQHFFPKHNVKQILDFTCLDAVLFKRANVPTAAIFVNRQDPVVNHFISHIVVRRTRSCEERLFFEMDKYDFHSVSGDDALGQKHIWKSNLLGGGRLHQFVARFSQMKSIGSFIDQKNWISGVGYEIGSQSKQLKSAPYITSHKTLPTRAFTEYGVDKNQIGIEEAEKFHRISDERLFTPPHLLIKKNVGFKKIPTYYSEEYLTFKDSILGIAESQDRRDGLRDFANAFEEYKRIYRVFIAATSNEYLVGRATTILNQDIKQLPFPDDRAQMNLTFAEEIICDDVLNHQIAILAKGSKAKANWKKAERGEFEKFGEVFTKMLNSIYGKSGKNFYFSKLYQWGDFCITEFDYGTDQTPLEEETINEPTDNIKSLIHSKYGKSAHLIKILKLYERNKVYLIKPNILRFWLQSIAIKDADEAFSDSIIAGY